MYQLYEFLRGPGAWIAFTVFFVGLAVRMAFLVGLSKERDKVLYNHFDWSWAWRSIFHWLIPLGSVSFRQQPIFGLVFWVFHVGLLAIPLFLNAHNVLWDEAFGISLPSLSDKLADYGTMVVMACVAFLFIRRLARPEVRILSEGWDYLLLILVLAPFLTGFLAYRQIGPYDLMLNLHIFSGELMLILIPFSKLGHIILFFFTRAFIGSEMGARREIEGRLGARTW
ncbi:MAG: nitrate reductase [Desulfarculus sp.]|nr:nitrate reductase [Desulfarculus sp.]